MGKGDQKTARGKRKAGSYGKTRPRKQVKKTTTEAAAPAKTEQPAAEKPKTTKSKKTEE